MVVAGIGVPVCAGTTGNNPVATTSDRFTYTLVPAPVANFAGTPLSGTAPMTVQFTDASSGSPTGWAWFFGDETYTQSWTLENASSGWSERDSQAVVTMPDGSIVLMGGIDTTGITTFNDTWRSTDNGNTWTLENASSGWSGRQGHTAVAMPDGSIVLMGGGDGNGTLLFNDTWRSTDNGKTWVQVNAGSGWEKRFFHSSVVMPDGSIVLMGGDNSDNAVLNDTWRSTDNGATWIQVNAGSGWSARAFHSSVVIPDGSIVLTGGGDWEGNRFFNDTWRSTDNGKTWVQVNASSGWSGRWSPSSVAMPDGSIVLTGGTNDYYTSAINDMWRSTDNGATWMQVNAGSRWSQRACHSSVAMPDGSIVLLGGNDGTTSLNDTWRLQPAGSSLKNPSHIYTTAGTYSVALQAFNAGGYDSMQKRGYIAVSGSETPVANFAGTPLSGTAPMTVQFTDASSGNPTGWAWFFGDETYTQSWTLKNASSGWSGRDSQAVVTMPDGSIVLMGGIDTTGNTVNDTWRSTDNGNTWTLENASSGWSGRQGHTAVAMPDGSIVLMGGCDGNGTLIFNDTWRSTDNGKTWVQVNAGSGWEKRFFHSSVVMPDGSIVLMGGNNRDNTALNDTWRSTDNGATWIQVNAGSGWSARAYHSSVVIPDGSIVLMGGGDWEGNRFFNDTWRSTDNGKTWVQVNASSGWSGRWSPSSVAMPDGSIVLMGGTNDYYKSDINDMWRSTDNGATWMQVNANSGWSARACHSSVAMPDGSIVLLGGNDGTTSLNDTWRLQPAGSSLKNPSHIYTTAGTYSVALQAFNAGGYDCMQKRGYIAVSGSGSGANIGVFRNSTGTWYLDYNFDKTADKTVKFGTNSDMAVVGDWNNAGHTEIGVFRPSTGSWYLAYTFNGTVDKQAHFGKSGDTPVVGDWNNAGHTEIGVFRNSTGTWYLDYNFDETSDKQAHFGKSGDIPVVGDWNNAGHTEIGVFRPSTGTWYLDYNLDGKVDKQVDFGKSGDIPVVGDWNNAGHTEIGVFRSSTGFWYLSYTFNGTVDKQVDFGTKGDTPVMGHWV